MRRVHRLSADVRARVGGESSGRGLAVIVGQAPSRRGDPSRPLTGRPGREVARCADLEWPWEYLATFDRVNVLERFPGPSRCGKGDAFQASDARAAALALAPELADQVVVLLGRGVARAFGVPTPAPVVGDAGWYRFWHVALRLSARGARYEAHEADAHPRGSCPFARMLGRQVEYPFAAVLAPHPSRVSRHWNSAVEIGRAEDFWRRLVANLRDGLATAVAPSRDMGT